MPGVRKTASPNGPVRRGRASTNELKLTQELAKLKKELQTERKLRKKLARALPLCSAEIEAQIPTIEQLRKQIANEMPFDEFLKTLWK